MNPSFIAFFAAFIASLAAELVVNKSAYTLIPMWSYVAWAVLPSRR